MRIFTAAGALGLAGIGALHIAWGAGSSWPLRSREELSDAVVGSDSVPSPAACYAVGGGLLTGAALVAGAGGGTRVAQLARWTLVSGLAARGVAGGEVAGILLGLPEASERFRSLDTTIYRPLCLVLSAAAATSALEGRKIRVGE